MEYQWWSNKERNSVCVFTCVQAAEKLAKATGRKCLPLAMDVRQPDTINAAVDRTLEELGHIDILINSNKQTLSFIHTQNKLSQCFLTLACIPYLHLKRNFIL